MGKKKRKKNKAPKQNSQPKNQQKAPAKDSAKAAEAEASKVEDSKPEAAEETKTAAEDKAPAAKAEAPEAKTEAKSETKADETSAADSKSDSAAAASEPKAEKKSSKRLPVIEPVEIEEIEFSKETMAEFEAMVVRYPERRGALLPTLRLIERDFGNISDAGMAYAAKLIGVSPAYVLGVVTFYTHYRRPSDGKYVIELCRTLPCALRGADSLAAHACKKLGIGIGETTEDGKITLKSVECIAACGYAPALQLNGVYHEKLTPEIFDSIVDGLE